MSKRTDPGATINDRFTARDSAPQPGDSASSGPRPRPTRSDAGWLALAIALTVITIVQLIGLTITLVRIAPQLTTGGLIAGFVVTVVWLLTIAWLVLGSWRRTVWGCPFDHTNEAHEARRCSRHALVRQP